MSEFAPAKKSAVIRRSFPFFMGMFVLPVVAPRTLALAYALQTEAPL